MLNVLGCVFYTELILFLRRSHAWIYPLAFFVIVISLFPLAFTPDPAFLQKYLPGCIWIAALFASLLSIENIFYTDLEDGNLEQLLLSQTPFPLLIYAKLAAQWLVTELPLIILTPLLGWLFHLPAIAISTLCAGLLLGTPILTLIGSLCVSLTFGLRQQGALLGLLVLPLVTPVLIFGVTIVQQAQAGFSVLGPLAFLAGMSLLAMTFLPLAIAATVRVGIDD